MNLRKMKKFGISFEWPDKPKKKRKGYKKGWSKFQWHHIENCTNAGKNSRCNKIYLSGKIHYFWHIIFGNLNPADAKLFLIIFLHGSKTKWKISEMRNLEFYIGNKEIDKAKKIADYRKKHESKIFLANDSIGFNKSAAPIGNKKINSHFLWCWNELFGELNEYEIQILISFLFGNPRKKWSIKAFRVLKANVKNNKIQEAASMAGLKKDYKYYIFTERSRRTASMGYAA